MKLQRAVELLNSVIDYTCIARDSHEAIAELMNMGFTADELVEDFSWSLTDVQEVEMEMRE